MKSPKNKLSSDFYQGPIPFPNYPRPQFQRENSTFINLNGHWDHQIFSTQDTERKPILSGQILVPFPPEGSLSGVNHILQPTETIIYTKTVKLDENFVNSKRRLFLNIDACDYFADISINDTQCFKGEIGYIPTSIEITDHVQYGDNKITISVQDPTDTGLQPIGKQRLKPRGIFYTSCSGIWQTIWLEATPRNYISKIKITPHISENKVNVRYFYKHENESQEKVKITVFDKTDHSKVIYETEKVTDENDDDDGGEIILSFGDKKIDFWSPDSPNLYDFVIEIGEDKISSYFGFREFQIKTLKNGQKRLALNGNVLFMSGLLDQGYWPESNLSPPSEEGILFDLNYVKKCGFNMIRKHIKVEPSLFYYHCDRLGIIVWQDIVNGAGSNKKYTFRYFLSDYDDSTPSWHSRINRSDKKSNKEFEIFIGQLIDHLYNVPSIGLWTLFNEGWGQFDSVRLTKLIKEKFDHTRPIDSTSGWYDQGENIGDFLSLHIYCEELYENDANDDNRAVILSEFGGYSLKTDDCHLFNPKKTVGYKDFSSREELQEGIFQLYRTEVFPCVKNGYCATVYTQLTDVETEINGLLTYDRKIQKISPGFFAMLHQELYKIGNKDD